MNCTSLRKAIGAQMKTEAFRIFCRDEMDQNINIFQIQAYLDDPGIGTLEPWVGSIKIRTTNNY